MNNGLIEREKVISTLRRVFEKYNIGFENGQGGFADEVPKAIKAIPTAYDVDKVVERLEELREMVPVNRLLDDIIKDKPKELGQLMAYRKAIEIVKSGGIE